MSKRRTPIEDPRSRSQSPSSTNADGAHKRNRPFACSNNSTPLNTPPTESKATASGDTRSLTSRNSSRSVPPSAVLEKQNSGVLALPRKLAAVSYDRHGNKLIPSPSSKLTEPTLVPSVMANIPIERDAVKMSPPQEAEIGSNDVAASEVSGILSQTTIKNGYTYKRMNLSTRDRC